MNTITHQKWQKSNKLIDTKQEATIMLLTGSPCSAFEKLNADIDIAVKVVDSFIERVINNGN